MILTSGAFISECFEHRPGALQMPHAVGSVPYSYRSTCPSSIRYGAPLKQTNGRGYHSETWERHGESLGMWVGPRDCVRISSRAISNAQGGSCLGPECFQKRSCA